MSLKNLKNLRKKKCPLTSKEEFFSNAPATLVAEVAGQQVLGEARTFGKDDQPDNKRSIGYYCTGKVNLTINGKTVPCQVGVNVILIDSKPLPLESPEEEVKEEAEEAEATA